MGVIGQIEDSHQATLASFDAVIDVRSPAEFAEDHIPGAINLPVLTNEQRAEVGTVYKQQSKFRARRIGAAYVAANIATHLQTALADKPPSFKPLVYCWRGGMRSNAMATVFDRVGWKTSVLNGGYKTWRRAVVSGLKAAAPPLRVVLVDGLTGTGKTEILKRAAAMGAQTIDLESLAAHRGSAFGDIAGQQSPSQKMFESLLWRDLETYDRTKPILIEAESKRIGPCHTPPALWEAMKAAPHIIIETSIDERARYLLRAYRDIIETPGAVAEALDKLRPFHAREQIEAWLAMAETGDFLQLAASLMRAHYDPLYERSRKRRKAPPIGECRLPVLDEPSFDLAAREIIDIAAKSAP